MYLECSRAGLEHLFLKRGGEGGREGGRGGGVRVVNYNYDRKIFSDRRA